MHLLGTSGSLRRDSHNTSLLRAAAMSLPSGVELELFDGLGDLPHYNADIDEEPAPEAVAHLREAIAGADGVLIATPEFNGSIPGALKNALRGRPVAVVGASTGLFGAVWAQAEVRKVLQTIGADVIDSELPVGQAHVAFGDDGHLADAGTRDALEGLVAVLASRAGAAEAIAT